MEKLSELLAALQRFQQVDQHDQAAVLASLREVAGAVDRAMRIENLPPEGVPVILHAVAGIFLAASSVGETVGGGTFADALEVLITPKISNRGGDGSR
jgi:hypothetical protein